MTPRVARSISSTYRRLEMDFRQIPDDLASFGGFDHR